jgi:tetratricopeptide (TPR) repeat protein
MNEIESLQRTLKRAKRALQILEEEKAGFGIRVPVDLQIEFEEKQNEVASLEARLAQLQGGSANTVPDNLPRYSTVFVGRKEEIARCLDALTPDDRGWGVIIDGIGGMGKTSLALEVADLAKKQAMFDAYLFASAKTTWLSPDGVREETLALSSLDAFCREFARFLGQSEIVGISDATERRRALLDALRGRKALLIWDNLETLTAEERDQIAEFLRKLPTPNKAIITSRYRTGESAMTIRLGKLSFAEAANLMAEVGRKQPWVARELRRVGGTEQRALYDATGGNPLALDWTLGLIAQKNYSFGTALGRLRDAGKSSDLYGFLFADALQALTETDLALLSALSAFFAPATIGALADITEQSPTEVRMGLERLAMLSLVNDLEREYYALHPLTRAYARANLEGRATLTDISIPQLDPAIRRQTLRYWVNYAQRYGGSDKDAYKTFDKLEVEWPTLEGVANLLWEMSGLPEALQDREAAQMAIDLQDALRRFLDFRGYWDERIRLSEWCYQAGQALEQWRDAGWGAYNVAWVHFHRKETDRAKIWADRASAAMERGGSRRDRASTTRMQGLVARQRGDWTEAEQYTQEALTVYRELGEEQNEAMILNDLGAIAYQQQQDDRAKAFYLQALEISEQIGSREGQAYISGSLGRLALDRDRLQEARTWLDRSLTLAREVGRKDLVADAQSHLVEVLEKEKRYSEALELARKSLQIRERLRHQNLEFSRSQVARLQQRVEESGDSDGDL